MKLLKTKLHVYRFDLMKPADRIEWSKLQKRLQYRGLECTESRAGGGSHYHDFARFSPPVDVELETLFVFSDHWYTAPILDTDKNGVRVFNWAKDYLPETPHIAQGHYLEQTKEMVEIRDNTYACGFCAAQYHRPDHEFCTKCLGSERLKEKELKLLRLLPTNLHHPGQTDRNRPNLTANETADLIPRYREAQIYGVTKSDKERIAKRRQAIIDERDRAIHHANVEAEGLLWLLDRGIQTTNVVYYSHGGYFAFGWKRHLSKEEVLDLAAALVGFPYPYELKVDE